MSEKNYTKICPSCKKEIDKYESVCPMCGQRFDIEYEDEMALYIRNNAGFYLGKFDKMETQNTKITWNWACFLFTGLWLIYRKMYNWFAAFILFWIAEGFVLAALGNFGIIDTLLNIAVSVLMGMYGNYLYKEKIKILIREGNCMGFEEKHELAVRKGGTSAKLVIAVMVLQVVVSIFMVL